MKFKRLLLLVLVMGFAVGCASTPEETVEESAPTPVKQVEEEACEGCDEAAMKDAMEPVAEESVAEDTDTGTDNGSAVAESAETANTSYMVEKGDNLWSISGQADIYDNPYQWPLIYKANREQIRDADLIYPGQDLTIVRGMSEYEIDIAVNHAKTRGAWTLGEVEATDQAYLNE